MANLLLLTDEEDLFLRQAIEAWSAIYAGDVEQHRGNRWNVMRKLDGKYTAAEVEEIGTVALGMMM